MHRMPPPLPLPSPPPPPCLQHLAQQSKGIQRVWQVDGAGEVLQVKATTAHWIPGRWGTRMSSALSRCLWQVAVSKVYCTVWEGGSTHTCDVVRRVCSSRPLSNGTLLPMLCSLLLRHVLPMATSWRLSGMWRRLHWMASGSCT